MGAEDARIAWYAVARHLQLLSMRDWTDDAKLAKALGVVRRSTFARGGRVQWLRSCKPPSRLQFG